jgi:hypothetical protein
MDAAVHSSVERVFKIKKADMGKFSTPVAGERARARRSDATTSSDARVYRFTPKQGECFSCGAPIDNPVAMQPIFMCRAHFVSYCQQCRST